MGRQLRTYQHVAQKEHWCDRCCRYIQPGEMYEGNVSVFGGRRLVVFKTHVSPACDFPEDPEEYKEKRLERAVKETLRKAA